MWLCAGEVPRAVSPPPAVIGSVSIHLLASLIYYFLSPPLSAPILPFISATAHLHCFHLLRWPGLVLLFWFIIGLFISLLVTHTIYRTFLTPVSARKPFIFHFTWISLSIGWVTCSQLLVSLRHPSCPYSPPFPFFLRSKRSWEEGTGETECISLHLDCVGDTHLLNKRKILSGSLQLSKEINALNGQFNNLERAGTVGSR